jgi:hypothetical protein
MQIYSVGIDLGKTTFHLVALGAAGKVLVKKKFTQRQLLTFTANLQTSLIGLEACSGAHFLGRAYDGSSRSLCARVHSSRRGNGSCRDQLRTCASAALHCFFH